MDGSDDYFFDEIVLDDQTLAVLDQEEKKYQLQTEKSLSGGPSIIPVQPATKRLKTNNGWTVGVGATATSREADEDLPEISLDGDGSYAIGHQINRPAPTNLPAQQRNERPPVRSGGVPNMQSTPAPIRHVRTAESGTFTSRVSYPTNFRLQNNPPQNQAQQIVDRLSMQNSAQLQAQMAELQKKLDELREENSKMQVTLKNALDTKFSKEGEVSILRKSIEKPLQTAQSHAAQISHLKTEKEKADAKQVQMQKDMKDEMERLRTQFVFRQQELESSTRKPPGSVRAKKGTRDFPSTPLAVPAAISSWHRGGSEATNSRRHSDETPSRPSRLPPAFKVSPTKAPRKSPEKSRKVAMLPGFENAFETSTPLRSPSKRFEKGKGKMLQDSVIFGPEPSQSFRPLSQISQGHTQLRFESASSQPQDNFLAPAPSSHFASESSQMNDEDMDIIPPESDEDPLVEELEAFDPISWKAELCRIILTHCHSLQGHIVFQQLINSSQFVNSATTYSGACARIMEVVANSTRSDDYQESIDIVSESLLWLLSELSNTDQLLSLAVLFNLLSRLTLSLPDFQSTLLSSRISLKGDTLVSIVDLISKVITKYLEPNNPHSHRDDFATEVISLLEALCFYERQESTEQIEAIAGNRKVLLTLLHPSQPTWLLERSTRLLVLLSTHYDLYKALLNLRNAGMEQDSAESPAKDILINILCSQLIDTTRDPTNNLKIYTLMYFAQLSMAHPDSHNILGVSFTLIPSLVMYISQLTTPLWEDDGSLASSIEATTSLIQVLNQTVCLLYHLIFGIEPGINLRYKLQHAPTRQFNSIKHIFIVTFGRLSYCDAPSWIETSKRTELEYLAVIYLEVSREILELMVDGPEGDSVWVAFQPEPDEEVAIDEEEMEAQFMGIER